MLAHSLLLACLLGVNPAEPEKVTVADVIKGLALDESKFQYSDEPPGKLREITCKAILKGTKSEVDVRIKLVYTTALFSDKLKWDSKAINQASVIEVIIIPRVQQSKKESD